MKILFTAAEIARMRLPGLPTTKSSILSRAAQVLEKWDLDERVGLPADEKGRLIAMCYKMLADGVAAGDLSALLAAVTRLVRGGSDV